jgi:ligand-binding sensor domain-containing protein
MPDSAGNLWFITHLGVVGYVKTDGTTIVKNLRAEWPKTTITKSLASDGNGRVFIVTNEALFCFTAATGAGTTPQILWRSIYDSGTRTKLGQNQRGCGTTPTCFDDFNGKQFVAIANNADPLMEVCVYNRQSGAQVAKQAVFSEFPYISSCENSLIAVNHSIIVENNYNNASDQSTFGALSTVPGINRVDFDPATGQSKVVWANNTIPIPSVVSQLSTADGCVYSYVKGSAGWYWVAFDFATGKTCASSAIMPWSDEGSGVMANNFYAGITVGPDGSAYLGVFGGIVAWRPNLAAGN